jgi:hypothetical protein
MRDKFDKEFGDIEWISDDDLRRADGRHRMGEANKNRPKNPNLSTAQKNKWKDKEYAKKMSAILLATTQDPERNKKISDSRKEYWADPENIANISKSSKSNWTDPAYVEKIMGNQRMAVTTPYGEFISQSEFGRQNNKVFKDLQKEMPHLYYVTLDGPGEVTTQKYLVTPLGEYRNRNNAFQAHVIAGELYTKSELTRKGAPWRSEIWWTHVTKNKSELFYKKVGPRREWDLE